MGITNCAANMMSILAPLVVGAVVDDAVSQNLMKCYLRS